MDFATLLKFFFKRARNKQTIKKYLCTNYKRKLKLKKKPFQISVQHLYKTI